MEGRSNGEASAKKKIVEMESKAAYGIRLRNATAWVLVKAARWPVASSGGAENQRSMHGMELGWGREAVLGDLDTGVWARKKTTVSSCPCARDDRRQPKKARANEAEKHSVRESGWRREEWKERPARWYSNREGIKRNRGSST